MKHEIVFVLDGLPELPDDAEEALFEEAGCEHLVFRPGLARLTFEREAEAREEAIVAVIGDLAAVMSRFGWTIAAIQPPETPRPETPRQETWRDRPSMLGGLP